MPPTHDYFMTTQRLGFRYWRAADVALAYGLWGDPRVARWIDARGRLSREQVRERLTREINSHKNHGIQYWPVFRLDTAAHVGCCGLRPYKKENRVYELGFHICPPSWRKGYAIEAARAVIAHAFERLHAAALFAGHHPRNRASRQLLGKLGFQYTHDEYYAATGCQHPSYRLEQAGITPAATRRQPKPMAASPRRSDAMTTTIGIEKAPIELYKLLKFADLAQSGGEAKYVIAQGWVRVNGGIETRKRKKIVSGDQVECQGRVFRIKVQRRETS